MGNMSYCRFQNTNTDLQDCIDAVDEMIDNDGTDAYDDELSHEELRAMRDMAEKANYFYERATELLELLEDKIHTI